MKKLILIIVLAFSWVGLGADYYVGITATGLGNGSDTDNLDDSIQAGIDAVGDGDTVYLVESGNYTADASLAFDAGENGKNITISNYNGSLPVLQFSSITYGLRLNAMTSGSITVQNITIAPTAAASYSIYNVTDSAAVAVTLDNVTWTTVASSGRFVYNNNAISPIDLTFRDSTITHNGTLSIMELKSADDITIDNCAISGATQLINATGTGSIGDVNITGSTFTTTSSSSSVHTIQYNTAALKSGNFNITGNTVTTSGCGFLAIPNEVGKVYIANNTVNINGSSSQAVALRLGIDSGLSSGEYVMPVHTNQYVQNPIVSGNTIKFNNAKGSHGILAGLGTINGIFENNYIYNGDIQIVVKGEGHIIKNNTLVGDDTILLKSSTRIKVYNNTCYSSGTYAIGWNRQSESGLAASNVSLSTTIASVTSNQVIVLTDGQATNNYYNGCIITVTDATDGLSETKFVKDYVSDKTLTTVQPFGFTPEAGDAVVIEQNRPIDCVIQNNIFYSNGSTYLLYDYTLGWEVCVLNDNLYYITGSTVFSNAQDTIALHKSNVWDAMNIPYNYNDTSYSVVNPQFKNVSAGDFRIGISGNYGVTSLQKSGSSNPFGRSGRGRLTN